MMLRQSEFLRSEADLRPIRERFIRLLALFSVIVGVMVIVAEVIHIHVEGEQDHGPAILLSVLFIALQGVVLITLRQRGILPTSVLLVTGLVFFSLASEIMLAEGVNIAFAILAVVAAAALAPLPVFVGANILVLGELTYDIARPLLAGAGFNLNEILLALIPVVTLAFVGVTIRNLLNAIQKSAEAAHRTADLLQASAIVGQFTSRLLNLNELLGQSIELIRKRFDFYHVQVFLLNATRDQAVLVASTGEVGRRLLARQHRLAVGSQSVIGQVTLRGEPVITSDTDRDSLHARNELLPDTRSELALPILDGDEIIGALDVQSTRVDAFSQDDVRALEITANLLATAIRNARLFEAQKQTAEENERLLRRAEENLREIERLNQQLTGASWQSYMKTEAKASGVTLQGNDIVPDSAWTPELITAGMERRPVTTEVSGKSIVAVPVILRGEVIGAIEVEAGKNVPDAETVDMVQAVAQRLALSLDNARLFEEAQSTTAQEHYINDIVGRYQTVNSVDDLLRITLTELSESLGAQRGAIRLGRFQNGDGNHVHPPA